MDVYFILGYFLALIVGVSLGLIGSGGSILTVPILVYLMGINPVVATAYSLFIVGITSLVGGLKSAKLGLVDFKKVIGFGIPSIIAVYLTRRYILPALPEIIWSTSSFTLTKNMALMLLFAVIMILAAFSMIKKEKDKKISTEQKTASYFWVILEGTIVGVVTGLVGAGGGFLIIPALVILAKTPMKIAVGTSLFIIALKSIIGFLGDLQILSDINWTLLISFTILSLIGIFIGINLTKKMDGAKLKTGFGYFVLIMAVYILYMELIAKN
jgi:uncharacterized membrane protein YfcA